MRLSALEYVESKQLRKDIVDFRTGDTVRVHWKVKEGEKERVQPFEGVVIRKTKGANRATFTVRKVSYGVGVERIFPLHSPRYERIDVVTRGSVSRNRLFYLRDLRGKASRVDVQEEALEVASVDAPVSAEAAAVEGSEPTAAPAPAKKAKGKKAKGLCTGSSSRCRGFAVSSPAFVFHCGQATGRSCRRPQGYRSWGWPWRCFFRTAAAPMVRSPSKARTPGRRCGFPRATEGPTG